MIKFGQEALPNLSVPEDINLQNSLELGSLAELAVPQRGDRAQYLSMLNGELQPNSFIDPDMGGLGIVRKDLKSLLENKLGIADKNLALQVAEAELSPEAQKQLEKDRLEYKHQSEQYQHAISTDLNFANGLPDPPSPSPLMEQVQQRAMQIRSEAENTVFDSLSPENQRKLQLERMQTGVGESELSFSNTVDQQLEQMLQKALQMARPPQSLAELFTLAAEIAVTSSHNSKASYSRKDSQNLEPQDILNEIEQKVTLELSDDQFQQYLNERDNPEIMSELKQQVLVKMEALLRQQLSALQSNQKRGL